MLILHVCPRPRITAVMSYIYNGVILSWMDGWFSVWLYVCAPPPQAIEGYKCPIPMRSVSRFNTARDLLSKYCHSVTERERQEGFTPDTSRKCSSSVGASCFFITLFPIKVALEVFCCSSVLAGRSQVMRRQDNTLNMNLMRY